MILLCKDNATEGLKSALNGKLGVVVYMLQNKITPELIYFIKFIIKIGKLASYEIRPINRSSLIVQFIGL